MPDVSEVIKALIQKHGGNQVKIAAKLGVTPKGKPFCSSQKLGHYASGKYKPKMDFYRRWKEKFGDDIEALVERNVSRETSQKVIGLDEWDELIATRVEFQKTVKELIINNQFFKEDVQTHVREKSQLLDHNTKLLDIVKGLIGSNPSLHKT